MTWVFAILTFSPKALYVDETTFSARCSGSGVWARSAQSSESKSL